MKTFINIINKIIKKEFPLPRDMVYFCQPDGTTSTSRLTTKSITMTMAMMMAMERMAKMMKTTIMMTMMLLMIKIISDGDRQLERRPASYSLSPIKTLASPGAEHGCDDDDDDGFNDADNIDGDISDMIFVTSITSSACVKLSALG